MRCIALSFVAALVLFTPRALRAEEEPDWSDPAVVLEEGEKEWGFNAVVDLNKKTGIPKKVAIGSFQMQFTMRTQDSDSAGSHYWVEFDDAAYQAITDALYDTFVVSLQSHGYEVVPKEAVLASEGYALLDGDLEPIKKGKKARFAASGMKLHKTIVGGGLGVGNTQTIPRLNSDLGTDSVLVVRANLGVIDIAKVKGVKKSKGIYPCLCNVLSNEGASGTYGSIDEYPGLSVAWFHGVYDTGTMPGGRVTYGSRGNSTMGFLGNIPFVDVTDKIVTTKKWNLFGNTYGAEADVLVNSSIALFDRALMFTWAQWDKELAKKAAKL